MGGGEGRKGRQRVLNREATVSTPEPKGMYPNPVPRSRSAMQPSSLPLLKPASPALPPSRSVMRACLSRRSTESLGGAGRDRSRDDDCGGGARSGCGGAAVAAPAAAPTRTGTVTRCDAPPGVCDVYCGRKGGAGARCIGGCAGALGGPATRLQHGHSHLVPVERSDGRRSSWRRRKRVGQQAWVSPAPCPCPSLLATRTVTGCGSSRASGCRRHSTQRLVVAR